MKRIAFATAILFSVLYDRDAKAQNFWYQPYGNGYGFSYVIPVGGGVGLNSGLGSGFSEAFDPTIAINLAEFGQVPNSSVSTMTEATVGNEGDENQHQFVKHKPKKKAALPVLHSKPIPLKYVKGAQKHTHK